MLCFRCIKEDGQGIAAEQTELKLERGSTQSPNFFESVEGAASLSNLGDDFFGSGSLMPRYLKWTTCSMLFSPHLMFIGELLVAMPLALLGLILSPKSSAFFWMLKSSA